MSERCFACDRPLTGRGFEVDTRDDQIVSVGSDCYQEVLVDGEVGWQPPKGGPRLYPVRTKPMSLDDFEKALDAVVRTSWHGGKENSDEGCPDEYAAVFSAYKFLLTVYEAQEADSKRLDYLEKGSFQLDWDDAELDERGIWRIHGGVNDRQWSLEGKGPSVRHAIDAALLSGTETTAS